MIITDITAQAISNFPNTSLAAPGALGHRLQNPKWLPEMADWVWRGLLGLPSTFAKISCLIRVLLL